MKSTGLIRGIFLTFLMTCLTLPMLALTAVVLLHDNTTVTGTIISATADELLIDPDGPVSLRRITSADASYFEVVELSKVFTFPINTSVLSPKTIRPAGSSGAKSALWKVPTLYFAPSIGLGGGFHGSSDIDELFDPGLTPLTVEANLGLRAGYRNIFQLEYRLSSRTATIAETVNMGISSSQVLFKLNPLSFGESGRNSDTGLFLVFGLGSSSSMLDDVNDGYRNGSLKTFGLEYFWVDNGKCLLGFSGSLEYESLKYTILDLDYFDIYYGTWDTSIGYLRFMINFYAGFDLGLK
jgi:hypothetical protein